MIALLCFFLTLFASPFKSKSRLEAENAALRHQLIVLQRRVSGRVQLTNGDRLFLVMDGAPSCVTIHRTSQPWIYSLPRPLASTCSMPSSSCDWPAEISSGSTSHLIRPRTGSHARSQRHSLGMSPRAT